VKERSVVMKRSAKPERAAKEKERAIVKPSHTHDEMAGALAGEVAGGILGAMAGPPGAVAGMVMGAATGALVGEILHREAERKHARDQKLDDDIGVTSGNLGAPNLAHPPATIGAFSAASVGAGSPSDRPPAEGPISTGVDE
jgi:phage tail tape-measure protein